MDGRPWVMGWREPTHLYRYPNEEMRLLTRHYELSDDVGYRFSNREWNGWPLMADTYANWLRGAMGELVFLAWDFETFGEHHRADSGIFPFMHALHDDLVKNKMKYLTPSEAIATFKDAHEMPLPEYGCTWAGDGGMDFFLGNEAQQGIFRLMHHIYNKAKLTKHPHLMDIAMWLLQSDNLHLIQWFGRIGPEAEVLLAEHGLMIGHYPQSFEYASLGGFAATRSSGQSRKASSTTPIRRLRSAVMRVSLPRSR